MSSPRHRSILSIAAHLAVIYEPIIQLTRKQNMVLYNLCEGVEFSLSLCIQAKHERVRVEAISAHML
jgi:hypothetical protein